MSNGLIYKVTNTVNNKCYIGLTTRSFETRIKEHFYRAENENNNKNSLLLKAISKYGKDVFEYEIIEENISDKKLDEKEIYYIDKYNTLAPHGYNTLEGGRIEAVRKMGKSNTKPVYRIEPETFEIIDYASSLSEMAVKVGSSPIRISDVCNRKSFTAKGYIFRFIDDYDKEEIIDFMSQKYINNAVEVVGYYLDNSEIIGEYISIYQASKVLNISAGNISDFCRGKRLTAGTYKGRKVGFYYKNKEYENKDAEKARILMKYKGTEIFNQPIELYEVESGEIIATYNNFEEAKSERRIYKQKLRDCLLNKNKYYGVLYGKKVNWRLK